MENVIYRGETLKNAVFETPEERKYYIHSLIPEHSVFMIHAPDGAGKSTLSLQMCIEACSGIPVFGGFEVEKPINVIYVMAERHRFEAFERIKLMSNAINIKWENFLLTDALQGYNLLNASELTGFSDNIIAMSHVFGREGVQLIYIDPLYALIPSKLVGEEGASAIRMTVQKLQSKLGCSVGYNHHSNRGVRDEKGKRQHGDMYGARFISANVTGMFAVTPTNGGKGTKFECQKDSLKCLTSGFKLEYNPETHLSLMDHKETISSKHERFLAFLRNAHDRSEHITFDQIKTATGVSDSHLRNLLTRHLQNGVLQNLKPLGEKALYQIMRHP